MAIQLLGAPVLLGIGFGQTATPIDAFLLQHPKPSSTEITEFLKAFDPSERSKVAQELIGKGVPSKNVAAALNWLTASSTMANQWAMWKPTILGALALASMGASAFHGYRRNKSIGWALWWALWGGVFPVVTPVIAVAQGFAKPKAA